MLNLFKIIGIFTKVFASIYFILLNTIFVSSHMCTFCAANHCRLCIALRLVVKTLDYKSHCHVELTNVVQSVFCGTQVFRFYEKLQGFCIIKIWKNSKLLGFFKCAQHIYYESYTI